MAKYFETLTLIGVAALIAVSGLAMADHKFQGVSNPDNHYGGIAEWMARE